MIKYPRNFNSKVINNAIKVVNGQVASGNSISKTYVLGSNIKSWGIQLPADLVGASIKVEAYLGKDVDGNEAWEDITNAMFNQTSLSVKGTYITTNAVPYIKIIYTASADTNKGNAHILVNA